MRQRINPSYLAQGSSVEGEHVDENSEGITIRDDRGVVLFFPWSSIASVVRNPEHADANPEPF